VLLLPAAVPPAAVAETAAAAGATASGPNLLVVSIDTLRADHTTPYGYGRDTTPGLSALAAQGTRFAVAYAPTPLTAPSHATLFTGQYPGSHGLLKNGVDLDARMRTLAEMLGEHGYQTAAVVSSFVLDARFGFDQGFDTYLDDFSIEGATDKVETWKNHAVEGGFDTRADDTTRRALRWLWVDRDAERPFFLFVHYSDPHNPYVPPASVSSRFPLPPLAAADVDDPAKQTLRKGVHDYDGEVAFVDQEVVRLLEELERLELEDETLVVVTADHGEGLMDHGRWFHGVDVHEEAVRIPLVVRWPGVVPAGRRGTSPVELVDLAPTLLDLLGIEHGGERFEGRSLAGFLRGEAEPDRDDPVFLHRRRYAPQVVQGTRVSGEQHAVIQGSWKLIDHSQGDDELYDLARDPEERDNRIDAEPERAAALRRLLDDWRSGHAEPRETPALDPEERRALEALGYVE
jgi:arylsulfatase A-like enzyme